MEVKTVSSKGDIHAYDKNSPIKSGFW